ncbi:MAG: type VI secretion system baseplate subunit TssF [Geminicoccaceae bacterium]
MRPVGDEGLLPHYERELAYLRSRGADFARQYPKVASALELGDTGAADPHVERLLEAFAFLTARVQRQLDDAMPEVPAALLSVLYPHLTRQVPSMAIAEIVVDALERDLSEGYVLPRHTALFARNEDGEECRFRTAFEVELWPLTVREIVHEPAARYDELSDFAEIASVVRVNLAALSREIRLETLGVDRLRFHLGGERTLAFRLLETLLIHTRRIATCAEGSDKLRWIDATVSMVGLEDEHALLPAPPESQAGYRLLQEYAAFPDKHLFIDVASLEGHLSGTATDLLFCIDGLAGEPPRVGPSSFKLHCVPIVNLFQRTSEPIRLDETHYEYRLVPDARALRSTEIYAIEQVSSSSDAYDPATIIRPFFSFDHTCEADRPSCFWLARRDQALGSEIGGTDTFLSFVTLDLDLAQPPARSAYAQTLCTNRHAAERVSSGARLEIEQDAPAQAIRLLGKPTAQIDPPLHGQTLWRLVSHLSLNHLSLESGRGGLAALKEILKLYACGDPASLNQQLSGLQALETGRAHRRIGSQVWRGFCHGTEIDLTVDPRLFVGSSPFVLGAVLDRFLALYAVCNSFTRLALRRVGRQGIWHAWPPRSGDRPLV